MAREYRGDRDRHYEQRDRGYDHSGYGGGPAGADYGAGGQHGGRGGGGERPGRHDERAPRGDDPDGGARGEPAYHHHPHPYHHQQHPEDAPPRLDRERACPFLLPVFVRLGDHSPPRAYHGTDGVPSDAHVSEMHIYTWEDATLLELAELVRERIEDVRTKRAFRGEQGGKRFPDQHFCLVYPDREGACGGRGEGLQRRPHTRASARALLHHATPPPPPLLSHCAGLYVIKGVGWVKDGAGRREREERLTLKELGHQVGDYLDIMYIV